MLESTGPIVARDRTDTVLAGHTSERTLDSLAWAALLKFHLILCCDDTSTPPLLSRRNIGGVFLPISKHAKNAIKLGKSAVKRVTAAVHHSNGKHVQ
jgi:hypothetical protein